MTYPAGAHRSSSRSTNNEKSPVISKTINFQVFTTHPRKNWITVSFKFPRITCAHQLLLKTAVKYTGDASYCHCGTLREEKINSEEKRQTKQLPRPIHCSYTLSLARMIIPRNGRKLNMVKLYNQNHDEGKLKTCPGYEVSLPRTSWLDWMIRVLDELWTFPLALTRLLLRCLQWYSSNMDYDQYWIVKRCWIFIRGFSSAI